MLYTELFYAIIPTLFSWYLLICFPYISLHFLLLFSYVTFFSSRCMCELKFAASLSSHAGKKTFWFWPSGNFLCPRACCSSWKCSKMNGTLLYKFLRFWEFFVFIMYCTSALSLHIESTNSMISAHYYKLHTNHSVYIYHHTVKKKHLSIDYLLY